MRLCLRPRKRLLPMPYSHNLITLAVFASVTASSFARSFTLSDRLGRHWEQELVEYTLTSDEIASLTGRKLVDQNGREVVYQLDATGQRLAFQATVSPFSNSQYTFRNGERSTATDLTISETDGYVQLENSKTGIRIAKSLGTGTQATPILSWRLASGTWVGTTRFDEAQDIISQTVIIRERGPVRSRVRSVTRFANDDVWQIDFELQSGESAVKISETFDCRKRRTFAFDFATAFSPQRVFSRSTSAKPLREKTYPYGQWIDQPLSARHGEIVMLEPWVHWGGSPIRTTRFSIASADWRDVVFFAACNAEKWVDPETEPARRPSVVQSLFHNDDDSLTLTWELATGRREYLIGATPGNADKKNLNEQNPVPTQGQLSQMRHSDFPLNRVKDYTLDWEVTDSESDGFLTDEHAAQLLAGYVVDPQTLNSLRSRTPTIHSLEQFLPCYLVTKDEQIERRLIDAALEQVQQVVDKLVRLENDVVTVGYAPHHYRGFVTTCNLVATICNSRAITPDERSRLRAQLAFLGYLFNRDAFSSPERGFAGFPNMTACVYGVRAGIASVLPGHPMRDDWMSRAVDDLKNDSLYRWSDADGNWNGEYVESLHYTRLTFDLLLGALYQSYRSGVDTESLYHPTIRLMGQWWAESCTPRDSRVLDWRHAPPVGHVYKFEMLPSHYALLAFLWKDRDPEFASNMKWMQLEQGNRQVQSVGGFIPSFAGYRQLFMANDITPKAPKYESRHWQEASVILRNHYNHELENMLYLIAGKGHSHYDRDSGSITLWGKGKIIADDFGYYGYAPGEDHNMLDSPVADPSNLMAVSEFQTGELADYVRGKKQDWTRRIYFVKHPDPKGPNYYVIRDTLAIAAPATWRMWFEADTVSAGASHVLVEADERISTHLFFAGLPEDAVVTTEEKTRRPPGVNSEGVYRGIFPSTQTGVSIRSGRYQSQLTLVFPRLKDQQPPDVTPVGDGTGFRITSEYGTDWVFLTDSSIAIEDGNWTFEGTAAVARIDSTGNISLDAQEGSRISRGDRKLVSKAPPAPPLFTNRVPDGRLNTGEYSVFPANPVNRNFTVTLQTGSPLSESPLNGDFCQKVTCASNDQPSHLSWLPVSRGVVYIDPECTYRVNARVYVPGKNRIYFSSYAQDSEGRQLKTAHGKTWQWSLKTEGPTDGFQEFETTLGPEGSEAENIFPVDAVRLDPGVRIYDGSGTFYVDDLIIEPVGGKRN